MQNSNCGITFLLYMASIAVSLPIFSKMSLMKEFMMDIAFEEIPVSCKENAGIN